LGYVPPNFIKVDFCLGTLKDLRHRGVTPFVRRQAVCGHAP
jgi:hypothetical protein